MINLIVVTCTMEGPAFGVDADSCFTPVGLVLVITLWLRPWDFWKSFQRSFTIVEFRSEFIVRDQNLYM